MGQLILETTFLIDFERETRRGTPGPAVTFLETHPDDRYYVTWTIAGELAAGKSLADRAAWEQFLGAFYVLPDSADVSWHYGRAYRYLQANNASIGANDLWIAAAGLAYHMPIVTANTQHFGRVPGLHVQPYRDA